ncbi:hypothetical protein AMELA_G00280690 [Ameiurus melas]|uniref:Phospholamban n=1 Tax=Ameiurus melas TaxID=219545 RepID=A0A7J5ZPB1_AMEME|nr:hypothetical protein AMELA_G00280690 [Ameiurus melas]
MPQWCPDHPSSPVKNALLELALLECAKHLIRKRKLRAVFISGAYEKPRIQRSQENPCKKFALSRWKPKDGKQRARCQPLKLCENRTERGRKSSPTQAGPHRYRLAFTGSALWTPPAPGPPLRASTMEVPQQAKQNMQNLFVNFCLILICLLLIYIIVLLM